MNDFFVQLIFGHLLGDYVFQTKSVAMNKSGNTKKCLIHCTIYTACVTLTTWPIIHSVVWTLWIFLSHFLIDRWSLGDKWLDFIKGRSLRDFIVNGKKDIPYKMDFYNYHALRGGFTAYVYGIVDNTLHLILMYYGLVGYLFFLTNYFCKFHH